MGINNQLIQDYGPDLYRFCLTLTRSKDLADDLYQDTFVLALTYGKEIEEENFRSLLFRIAHRNWKDGKRKWARRNRLAPEVSSQEVLNLLEDQGPSVEETLIKKQRARAVNQAILDLPDPMREVVLLFYMEEASIKEVARILDSPEGTVKSRLYHAKQELKKRLKEYQDD